MSSTGLTATTCPASAYLRSFSPDIFHCSHPRGHDGAHGCQLEDGRRVSWRTEEPFDRSREQWFTGICVYPGCYGGLTGRSLDGAPAYWWHEIKILDNDHDADPGDRKEP